MKYDSKYLFLNLHNLTITYFENLTVELIVDLALVDSCVVKRYKTSLISQRVTHKYSKSLKNVARVSLLYVDKLE